MVTYVAIFYMVMSLVFAIYFFHKFCDRVANTIYWTFVKRKEFLDHPCMNTIMTHFCSKKNFKKMLIYFSLFFFFAVGFCVSVAGWIAFDGREIASVNEMTCFEMVYVGFIYYIKYTLASVGFLAIGIPAFLVTPTYNNGDGEKERIEYEAYLEREANGTLDIFEKYGINIFTLILKFKYWFIGYIAILLATYKKKYAGETN